MGELIVYQSLRHPSVKFHMETSKDAGTKVYSNGPGHLTKMAAMPIYVKTP